MNIQEYIGSYAQKQVAILSLQKDNHVSLLDTVQFVLLLTSTVPVPPEAGPVKLVGATVNVGPAAWVTLTCLATPPAVTFTLPTLARVADGLGKAVIVNELPPLPLALLEVNHDSIGVTVQLVLLLTSTVPVPPWALLSKLVGASVNVAPPDWVNVIVLVTPPAETVTLPLLVRVTDGLGSTVTVNISLPMPLILLKISQFTLRKIDQEVLL